MGRTAGGVRAMKFPAADRLIGVDVLKKEHHDSAVLLVMGEHGLGKKTEIGEYKTQNRGGSGIKTAKVTTKTGELIAAKLVTTEEEVIAMSKKGQVIRTELKTIPTSGRQTQGVTIMKMRVGDSIASLVCM
jgi:DNA gyrase subunit A